MFFLRLLIAAPSFVNVTRKVHVKKNEEVVLDCNAEGHPEPNVTMFMYKNGRIQSMYCMFSR